MFFLQTLLLVDTKHKVFLFQAFPLPRQLLSGFLLVKVPRVTPVQDTFSRLEQLHEDVIESVAALTELFRRMEDDADETGEHDETGMQEFLDRWSDAADEHGWNPAAALRVGKGIVELCKQGE